MTIARIFHTLLEDTIIPTQYIEWATMSLVSAVLQRRCYTVYQGRKVYPNTYTVLIGPSGCGKTFALDSICVETGRAIEELRLAPKSTTPEMFYHKLAQSQTPFIDENGNDDIQCALTVFHSELRVLIDGSDDAFIQALCDIFDCGPLFDRELKTVASSFAHNPCLTICGATQPASLPSIFNALTLERGILRRFFFVYANEKRVLQAAPRLGMHGHDLSLDGKLRAKALACARKFLELVGPYDIDLDAYEKFVELEKLYREPVLCKVKTWFENRDLLLIKLAMVRGVINNEALHITLKDIEEAALLLEECGANIERAMAHVVSNPMTNAIMNFYDYASRYMESRGLVMLTLQTANLMLLQYVQPTQAKAIMEQMITSGLIVLEKIGSTTVVKLNGKGNDAHSEGN